MEEKRQKKKFSVTLLGFAILFLLLFSCSLASAMDWDNVKEFELGELEYGKITIYNAFGLPLIGDKLAEYTLEDNTDQCLINCHAEGTAKIYAANRLFSDLDFYNRERDLRSLRDSKILIEVTESYEVDVPEYYKVCEEITNEINETVYQDCQKTIIGSNKEIRYKTFWKEYKGEVLEEGDYRWRIEAKKNIEENIDWIGSAFGESFTEWAWWGGDWTTKRLLSNLTGDIIYIDLNYTNFTGALANWSDLRFIDATETTEYGYVLQKKVDSANATFRIKTLNASSLYIYYDNDAAPSTSNIEDVYGSNLNSSWFMDATSGVVVDATGNNNLTNNGADRGVEGKIGYAFDFEVDDLDYLNGTGSTLGFERSDSFSFSWWVKFESSTQGLLFTKWDDDGADRGYSTNYNFAGTQFESVLYSAVGSDGIDKNFEIVLSTGAWNHIVLTYDGSSTAAGLKMYVNNSEITDVAVIRDDLSATTLHAKKFHFGTRTPAGFVPYDGVMDEAEVWNKVLNSTEIGWVYNIQEPVYVLGAEIVADARPNVTLNTPANATNFTSTTVVFNCTASDDINLINVSLYINGVLNETNSSGINNTDYLWPRTLDWESYNWTCEGCDNLSKCTTAATRTFTVNKTFENFRTYNATSYETAQETFVLNLTSGGIETVTATLYYDGVAYTTTKTGNNYEMEFSTTFDILEGVGNNTFYWKIHYGAEDINTYSSNQTIIASNLTYCTTGTDYLNFTFKDEADSSDLNATIDASTFYYWLGSGDVKKTLLYSNTTVNISSHAFCFTPVTRSVNIDSSVQYSYSGFPQRKWDNLSIFSNSTTNIVLYLLASTDGIYTTFQVLSSADQPIEGVYATATRAINGDLILIGAGTTGDDGGVTFWVNPDYSHTFAFTKTGYDDVSLTITPTQSTYTVYMGAPEFNESFDFSRGIYYTTAPELYGLINDTYYVFNFSISSSYWDLTDYGFTLVGNNGTSLGSNSGSTGSGSNVLLNVSTSNYTWVRMNYYWNINGNYSNGSRTWGIEEADYGYGFKTFFTHLKSYTEQGIFGLNEWSRTLIIFILIFIVIGMISYASGLYSPAAISIELFALVAFFDVVTELLPSPAGAVAHFPTIITGLVMIVLLIREAIK